MSVLARSLRPAAAVAFRQGPSRHVFARMASTYDSYNTLLVDVKENVGVITLNRPKALNALCDELISELNDATSKMDEDDEVRCIVVTGSEKAFAAGADISEMAKKEFVDSYRKNMFKDWTNIMDVSKPIIAAVNGYALGGGCELAMSCDIIIAGDRAKFGQPEITLGVIPGCGGTQRLVKAVGKSKAMEMVLTGKLIDAEQAEKDGLVSRVVPAAELMESTMSTAKAIASFSLPIAAMCKEAVNASYDLGLNEGLRLERRLFHAAFATQDQKEGMDAFLSKRSPEFKDL